MNNNSFLKPTDEFRTYKALEEIEKNPSISQRDLASILGVALGISNACIHTLIKKGLIKIRGKNNRSITYHLTKQGIFHKSKMAIEWSKNTINFYREMRSKILQDLEILKGKNIESILAIGTEELVEILQIVAPSVGIIINGSVIINNDVTERNEESKISASTIIDSFNTCADKNTDCILLCEINIDEPDGIENQLNTKIYKLFRISAKS